MPAPPPASPKAVTGNRCLPWLLVGGCLAMLFLTGLAGLGLWWWRSHPDGFNLPSVTGAPEVPATTSSAPGDSHDETTPATAPDNPPDQATPATGPDTPPDEAAPGPVPSPTPSRMPDGDPDRVEWGPSQQEPTPIDTVIFEDRGDLDSDGREEVVQVVAVDGNPSSTTRTPRRLQILRQDGTIAFQTDPFTEPFSPDLDHLADKPWNRAGVHVVPGKSRWPDVRLVFASASGNYVVFRYDGETWQLVDEGG